MVDIVIGTHRLLSKDVEYKDLGLLIIDEEQRFGVAHKEKIKQLKTDIDVLTLTATPIPRTLHMSLVGIRDMSVLEEAPQERVPIQTYVMEYNEEMVREAISRELARGGQVYYVYNRVNSIVEITNRIAALVPQAQVAFAHGQMKEHELEKIMFDFINGDIDVLCHDDDHRDRSGYLQCEYDDHSRCRQYGIIPALSAARSCRTVEPDGICLFDVPKK